MTAQIELIGGPLDGMTFPDTGISPDDPGAYMIVGGAEDRAVYEPHDDDAPRRWHFQGWTSG